MAPFAIELAESLLDGQRMSAEPADGVAVAASMRRLMASAVCVARG